MDRHRAAVAPPAPPPPLHLNVALDVHNLAASPPRNMDISLSHGPASRKSLSFSSFHAPKQANAVNTTICQRPQPTAGHDAQADSAEANGRRLTLRSSPVVVIFLFVDRRSSSSSSQMQIVLPACRIVVPASSLSRRWRDRRPPRLNGGESGGRGAQEQRRQ